MAGANVGQFLPYCAEFAICTAATMTLTYALSHIDHLNRIAVSVTQPTVRQWLWRTGQISVACKQTLCYTEVVGLDKT